MMDRVNDFFRIQNYYPYIAHCSLPTTFVMLRDTEIAALSAGEKKGPGVDRVVRRLDEAMAPFPRKRFVGTDFSAPTDSERYLSSRRGLVTSGAEAWDELTDSEKLKNLAASGGVRCISVRAFRVFDVPREFRLFVRNGELKAMSQRFLVRHFHRLERRRAEYWDLACEFVESCRGLFPVSDFSMDIYITSGKSILVLDLNPWGDPTERLMLHSWEDDFSKPLGCLIVPPPHTLSGDVNVSF